MRTIGVVLLLVLFIASIAVGRFLAITIIKITADTALFISLPYVICIGRLSEVSDKLTSTNR